MPEAKAKAKARPRSVSATASPTTVYQAMNNVQLALKAGIAKQGTNKYDNYNFRGIDQILNVLGPILADQGLLATPTVEERIERVYESKNGGAMLHVTLRVRYTFVSVADPSPTHDVTVYAEGSDRSDKATNKAMSAAYKYAMIQAFAIPVEGEPDADAETPLMQSPQAEAASIASQAKPRGARRQSQAKAEESATDGGLTQEEVEELRIQVIAAGLEDNPGFWQWIKTPVGKYDQVKARQLPQIESELKERIREKSIRDAEQKQGDDYEFDDDIPF